MGLREIRCSRNLSQRELSKLSGVNFRSLQDYEQGHKQLASASYDVLFRLSTVLGCTMEELVPVANPNGAPLSRLNTMSVSEIQNQRFFCDRYATAGRWLCNNGSVSTTFFYDGQQHFIPMDAIFTFADLSWLIQSATLQIEEYIEDLNFSHLFSLEVT